MRFNLAGTVVALALGANLAGCGSRTASAADLNTVAIAVEPAGPPAAIAIYEGPGTVVPLRTYDVAFEVRGRVATVRFDVGERVSRGAVLASLDPADYEAQARAASAQAAAAIDDAEKADRGARPEERAAAVQSVEAAQAQLARAESGAALARANAARARSLFAQGAISAQTSDQASSALADADAGVASARAQFEAVRDQSAVVLDGVRSEDRDAARAAAQAAQANADLAAISLAKTDLTSPADAYVEGRRIEPGDEAQPGTIAFVLVDAARPEVSVDIPERLADAVRLGTQATIVADGRKMTGTVVRLEPAAAAETRTVEARLRIDGTPPPLGAVVDVLVGRRETSGAAVPLGAVITDPTGSGASVELYDATHRTVIERPVTVEATSGELAIVRGIVPGEPVVIAGEYQAKPGTTVRVVPAKGGM